MRFPTRGSGSATNAVPDTDPDCSWPISSVSTSRSDGWRFRGSSTFALSAHELPSSGATPSSTVPFAVTVTTLPSEMRSTDAISRHGASRRAAVRRGAAAELAAQPVERGRDRRAPGA